MNKRWGNSERREIGRPTEIRSMFDEVNNHISKLSMFL